MTLTKSERRTFLGEEKMVILRRHLVDKRAVSDVCDEAGIKPTLFYRWQKELFEHGAAAFDRRGDGPTDSVAYPRRRHGEFVLDLVP